MKFILTFLCSAILFVNCTSTKISSNIDFIEFGHGGGFAGRFQTYKVDIRKKEILKEDGTLLKTLSKKEINNLAKKLNETDFLSLDFNHPHNMSYYISFSGKLNNKIVWGDPASPAPQKVKDLYSMLSALIK